MRLDYQIIGWRAAVLRQLAGLDQRDAAKLAGITLRTWQNMERGAAMSGSDGLRRGASL